MYHTDPTLQRADQHDDNDICEPYQVSLSLVARESLVRSFVCSCIWHHSLDACQNLSAVVCDENRVFELC